LLTVPGWLTGYGRRKAGAQSLAMPINCQGALISVAISTYNRHDLLRQSLLALQKQTLPRDQFDVLVIDNSDDEAAREAFAREVAGTSEITLVHTSPPGTSLARNKALALCATQYIAFLDDDAVANPGWLAAMVETFEKTGAAVVAGPIVPVWPDKEPPDWIPRKHIACLTILDHGPDDRWLGEHEYAWGANMAFNARLLREVGSFSIGLGRQGSRSLMSEEEVEAQIALRARGYRIYYAAAAGVSHHIDRNRLSKTWFRARFAWQAVSALLRKPPLADPGWSHREIAAACAKLGIGPLVASLMTFRDSETFSVQLELFYHLFALILGSKDVDDEVFDAEIRSLASNPPRANAGQPTDASALPPETNAPIARKTRHLFVEGYPRHFYMYNLYASLPDSQLFTFPQDSWERFDESLDYTERSLSPNLRSITFMTVEPLIFGPSRPAFAAFLGRLTVPCFGIMHRLPSGPEQVDALREISALMKGLIVLADEMVEIVRNVYGIHNVYYLPNHPSVERYLLRDPRCVRERIGARPHQTIFSLLGEARTGKGFALMMAALDCLSEEDKRNFFFLIGGRARDVDPEQVAEAMTRAKVPHHLDLHIHKHKVAVLTERAIGEYFNCSDCGLLLYQDQQRALMSGVLPNFVWERKPVIATADSIVGRVVRRYDLGITLAEEDPESLANAMRDVRKILHRGWIASQRFEAYRAELSADSAMRELQSIIAPLGESDAGSGQVVALPIDKRRLNTRG
jgi:GT2 family glycosyltransferase